MQTLNGNWQLALDPDNEGRAGHWFAAVRPDARPAAAGCLKHSIPGDFNLARFEEVQALASGAGTGSIQR